MNHNASCFKLHVSFLSMANSLKFNEITVNVGDTVRVSYAFVEKGKEKLQDFEGIVLRIHGMDLGKSFTVRRMTRSKIGVERIFPLASPFIKGISIVRKAVSRKASARFIRDKSDKEIRERLYT